MSPGAKRRGIDPLARRASWGWMDKDEKPPRAVATPKPAANDAREARLAAALRANLRRRKAAAPKPGGKSER